MGSPDWKVEFLGTAARSTLAGSAAAIGYRFRIDRGHEAEQETVVWVVSLPVKYSRRDVERAAEILVRIRLEEGADVGGELELDAEAMRAVARHPSWGKNR